jgi:DNA invertase Pin-like site-specific DNA recombinase
MDGKMTLSVLESGLPDAPVERKEGTKKNPKKYVYLSPEQREQVKRMKLAGRTHREIADRFGISTSSSVAICKEIRDNLHVVFRKPV